MTSGIMSAPEIVGDWVRVSRLDQPGWVDVIVPVGSVKVGKRRLALRAQVRLHVDGRVTRWGVV